MAAIFESPYTLAYHIGKDIIVNGVNIFRDIEAAIAHEEKGDMLNMGRDIGRALALLILGEGNVVIPIEAQGDYIIVDPSVNYTDDMVLI